ncbi:hypothetical protein OEZ86_014664 [Tetradesmus obliquus]|nr:hypothetical protein OEZ86_014664 [Tetradesmus obliquus]
MQVAQGGGMHASYMPVDTSMRLSMKGMFLPAEARPRPYSRRSFDAADVNAAVVADCVGVQLQRLQPYGLVHVEFQQGLLLSQAKPLLVVDSAEVAAELQGMLQCVQRPAADGAAANSSSSSSSSSSMSQAEAAHVLVDFGRLLDFRAVFERHRGSLVLEEATDSTEEPPAAPAAAAAAVNGSSGSGSGSSSGFGSAAAAATRRLKDRLSFAQLVRNRSFTFGRRSAAGDALAPPRRDSGSSCGGSFSLFSPSNAIDKRRSQSLDLGLGSSRSAFLAALRSRSFRLGGSGHSFRSGSASPASRNSLDGSPPVETSGASASNNSSAAVAQVLQQRRRQWQEQQQQLRGMPEQQDAEDAGSSAAAAAVPGVGQRQMTARVSAAGSSNADGDADTVADDDSAFCVAVAAPAEQQQQQQEEQAEAAEEAEAEEAVQMRAPTQHPLLGPEYIGCMMDVGVRLLCFFVDRGLPAAAQMVLDTLLTAAAPAASFPTLARAAAGSDGLGLLHRAVRSGSTPMLLAVMGWGVRHRHCFAWDAPGPMGLTPLHLAALLGKQKRPVAAMVLQSKPGLAVAWFSTKADNGATPAMFATTMGLTSINQLAHGLLQQRAGARARVQQHRQQPRQQQQQQQQRLDTQLLRDQQRAAAQLHSAQQQQQRDAAAAGAVRPLGVPHSSWTLAFEDARLEGHYRKVLADSRLAVDAVLSAFTKTAVHLLPLFVPVVGWVQMLLPLAVLPLLYVCEHVDRNLFLLLYGKSKHSKLA